jgi:hypothetical protein
MLDAATEEQQMHAKTMAADKQQGWDVAEDNSG